MVAEVIPFLGVFNDERKRLRGADRCVLEGGPFRARFRCGRLRRGFLAVPDPRIAGGSATGRRCPPRRPWPAAPGSARRSRAHSANPVKKNKEKTRLIQCRTRKKTWTRKKVCNKNASENEWLVEDSVDLGETDKTRQNETKWNCDK